MSENIFQILLLLSYLDIALISITITVYAISVSYLGRQTSRSISRRKRRVTELRETLAKLTSRIKDEKEVNVIQNEIAYYKKQRKSLERNLLWLSVKGAVLAPTTFFSISLLLCVFGILEVLRPEILLALSPIFVLIGSLCLGKTLVATERASLEVPQPTYDVFFRTSELMTMKCKANTPTEIRFTIHNIGDESAENMLVVGYIPKGIEVKDVGGRWKKPVLFSEEKRKFATVWSVEEPGLNIDTYFTTANITIFAKQTGTYKILIIIKDNRGTSTHELTLRVE